MRTRVEHLVLHGYSEQPAAGTARIAVFAPPDRWRRALKGLGVSWGLAVLSVFIPVAHFILVPGFGAAGILLFIRRLRIAEKTEAVHGICPDCGTEQQFDRHGPWRLPLALTCHHCRRTVTARGASGDDANRTRAPTER